MAELTTLARPYAKAAFEYALAAGDLAGWSKMLGTAAAVAGQEQVSALLSSPALTGEQQVEAFANVCGDELTEKGQNFLKALSANKRLSLLPEIYQLFVELKAAHEKSVDVEVISAYEIDGAQVDKLSAALTESLKQQVKLQTTVDESLIGGVVIRTGDSVIDSSVRGKLAKLAERLAS